MIKLIPNEFHIAHIVPVGILSLTESQEYNMFLTHLVEKHPEYAKFAADCTGFKILDNSLIELGGAVDIGRVVDAAFKIGAHEIVLPDVFMDSEGTMKAVDEAMTYMYKNNLFEHFNVMAVCHGQTPTDWKRCNDYLSSLKELNTIGIPKILTKQFPFLGREYFVNNYTQGHARKQYHLLGLAESIKELARMDLRNIRGMDSSFAPLCSLFHIDVIEGCRTTETIDLENYSETFDLLKPSIKDNMRRMDEYASSLGSLFRNN